MVPDNPSLDALKIGATGVAAGVAATAGVAVLGSFGVGFGLGFGTGYQMGNAKEKNIANSQVNLVFQRYVEIQFS